MFERALAEDKKRKILLIDPNATKQIKSLFECRRRYQVRCLDEYFGNRNNTYVNKEIAKALLDLANA